MPRVLTGLARILAIVGVTLCTVAAIIWSFTRIVMATNNFPLAMLCVYFIGGLAAVVITFVLNVGSRNHPRSQ